MMSASSQDLVVLTEDLQKEVEAVQHLRKVLHDAYIVETKENTGTSAAAPPPAVDVHRTLDAPTLALLKAPNYPFLLCEGAPPAYVPPPVPYDVQGEVNNMKTKVLQVQRDLVVFQERYRKTHTVKPSIRDTEEVKKTMRDELVEFLDGHEVFSELAWQVSSLEWFYRWVLSHSISHLWNGKDQLEFVLTENGQAMPATAEIMDDALEEIPFTQAVTILDNDRQSVIALERRRLRSVSRTFRDRLPPMAITAATSCYLSSEEKYMYQEFYNQSEHLLLLLDHTMLMDRSASRNTRSTGRGRRSSTGNRSSPSGDGGGDEVNNGALITRPTTTGEVANVDGLMQEALAAYNAEHEVITTLMETIRERRRDGIRFAVSDDEYQRSRKAQIAVYGCVVSDMNLMAQQMAVAKEFLDKYEEWVRFHGFDTHDGLMQLLVERSGGSRWPYLNTDGAGSCDGAAGSHSHFVPPTAVWAKEHSQPRNGDDQDTAPLNNAVSQPASRSDRANGSPSVDGRQPLSLSTTKASLPGQEAVNASVARSTSSATSPRSPTRVADLYYSILLNAEDKLAEITNNTAVGNGSEGGDAGASGVAATYRLERMWMAAAMRQTVRRLSQSRWTSNWLLTSLPEIEDQLTSRLRLRDAHSALVPNACALLAMVRELLVLSRKTMSTATAGLTAVRVALHGSGTDDDLRREVSFALCPVEYERWGAVLDALWFQADPTGSANGGLLLPAEAASADPQAPGFQRLEKVALPVVAPPTSPTASAATRPVQVPVVTLFYRAQTAGTQPVAVSRQRPASTIAALLQKESASALTASSSFSLGGVAAQCARRYRYARTALAALYEVEAKGLLPCYASRISECGDVPLESVIFLSQPSTTSDVMGLSVGLLPPGAVHLLRLYNHTELRRPPAAAVSALALTAPISAPFDVYSSESVNFSSIGVMVASLLSRIATACQPVLKDLYMTAESTQEQATWEQRNRVVPKSFVNATTQPTPMSCPPAQMRPVSIQRESSVPNRNSISLRRFIAPLLRHMDDYLVSADFAKMAAEGESDSEECGGNANGNIHNLNTNHHASTSSPSASATARKTDLYGGRTNTSPSPSAVRPRGYQ